MQFLFNLVNIFHNKLWINKAFPEYIVKELDKWKEWTYSNKHDTCCTLSVEGLSTVKGHLNTVYMAYKSLKGQRKCVQPNTIRYIRCLIYPAHGEIAHVLCSGQV